MSATGGIATKPSTSIHYRIEGLGPVPSFKNNKQIIKFKGRPMITTNSKRKAWMDQAIWQIKAKLNRDPELTRVRMKRESSKIKDRASRLRDERQKAVSLRVVVGISDLGSADLDGALATICDVLVRGGAIADDAPRYVKSKTVIWVPVSPGEEHADIAIAVD